VSHTTHPSVARHSFAPSKSKARADRTTSPQQLTRTKASDDVRAGKREGGRRSEPPTLVRTRAHAHAMGTHFVTRSVPLVASHSLPFFPGPETYFKTTPPPLLPPRSFSMTRCTFIPSIGRGTTFGILSAREQCRLIRTVTKAPRARMFSGVFLRLLLDAFRSNSTTVNESSIRLFG
jgi:hypothetical protein